MKIKINRGVLGDALTTAGRAVSTKSPIPVLSHLLLEARGNELCVTGSDLDTTIQIKVLAEVMEPGGVSVPASLFQSVASKLPAGEVTIETIDTGQVNITCGTASFDLSSLPAEEYPSLPTLDDVTEMTLPQDVLAEGIKLVSVAAATKKEESRAVMTGIRIYASNDQLSLSATDGRRLAHFTAPTIGSESLSLVVPASSLAQVAKRFTGGDTVALKANQSMVCFMVDGFRLFTRQLEGRFPQVGKVIPQSFQRSARVGRKDLLESIGRVMITAQEKRSPHLIRMAFRDGSLTIRSNTPDLGCGEDVLDIIYEGEPLEIGFSGRYVSDGLKAMSCDEVQIDLQSETQSAVIRPAGEVCYDYVVMPVKLRDVVVEEVAA